jgi:hypothetical protein
MKKGGDNKRVSDAIPADIQYFSGLMDCKCAEDYKTNGSLQFRGPSQPNQQLHFLALLLEVHFELQERAGLQEYMRLE